MSEAKAVGYPALQVLDLVGPWRQVLPPEYASPSIFINDLASTAGRSVWPEKSGQDVETWVEDGVAVLGFLSPPHEMPRRCSDVFTQVWHDGDRARAENDLVAAVEGRDCSDAAGALPNQVLEQIRGAYQGQDPARRVVGAPVASGRLGFAVSPAGCPALNNVRDFIARYIVLPGQYDVEVLALWVAHTYLIDAFEFTPRLLITSPQKNSGKTRVLDVLDVLACNPLQVVNASVSSIYRSVSQAQGRVTFLIDELDTVLHSSNTSAESLHGLLNGGYKRGAKVTRSRDKASAYETQEFSTFAPVAMAGLGSYKDTLASRSINISMRRRTADESVHMFRRRDVDAESRHLRVALENWADDVRGSLSYPELPDELTDRSAEVWEPLLAVADLAGGNWPEVARAAAVAAVAGSSGVTDPATKALAEIRSIFNDSGKDRLCTREIIESLSQTDDPDLVRLDPISLSGLLVPYGISPLSIRVEDKVNRGYRREDFEDTWARYL